MLPGILPCRLILLQSNLCQHIWKEKSLGNIYSQINTFGFRQHISLPTSQARHWKSMRETELAGSVSPYFFFFPRSKEIFQEIYFSKKQFKAKSKVHPDSREILFGSPSSVVFWGKLPSVTMENLDLPKLELSSYTSRGKGGVQMAVAAQLLLKFMKPVGQIIYAAPYPPQGVTYNQRGWNSPPILTFIYKIIKC